jgi:histidyl-tRNA synthetase
MTAKNNEPTKKLSTESYKGVRDFYPEDMFIQKYIFERMRKAVEKFGYVEYGASVLEPAELYRAKSGEEIVNEQTYMFTDRGDREVTLRPEMTPTVARMVAAKRRELSFPLRWYSIPNLFRYEKPQRGRTREHWQLNVDLFGSDNIEADVEVISVAHEVMHSFGATNNDFRIEISHRDATGEALRKILKQVNINDLNEIQERISQLTKLIDRKKKMSSEDFRTKSVQLSGDPDFNDHFFALAKESEDIIKIINNLKNKGINNVSYNPEITRGFDYYTGMVFEVFDTNPENRRALFGGGRYDDLTSLFGGEKIPAVGFGAGDVTMRDFMETHGLLPTYKPTAKLYIAIQDESCRESAEQLATTLRAGGTDVALDISHKKLGDQIKIADRQKIPFVTAIGTEEVKSAAYRVKNLADGTEKILKAAEIADYLKTQSAL